VIMMKERTRLMDASTGGTDRSDPEYYRLTVEYAMRLTWTGEFLHAAPWSVGSQGRANVSHGCTGMSTSNAAWLYANSTVRR
jgi:lipoprotein-anchoring transpeptidase ErfK/SrfK